MTGKQEKTVAFYNGACPVCRHEMTTYERIARRDDLALATCDVAGDPAAALRLGIDGDKALRRLHALDEKGQLHRGYDAMLLVWCSVPQARWLARLFGNRLTRRPSAWLYENVVSLALYRWAKRRQRRATTRRGR